MKNKALGLIKCTGAKIQYTAEVVLTVAVVAEAAVRCSWRAPHVAGDAPLQLDLLAHVLH